MFKNFYDQLLKQLSLDFNCTPDDFKAKENIITFAKLNESRRSYSSGVPFLQMVTTGSNTIIMADECLHDFLNVFVKDVEGHRLFEFDNLMRLNDELQRYGYKLNPTHHMFLPFHDIRVEERFHVKWFYDNEIDQFYGDSRFPNAIAFPEPCPMRPDRIAVVATDNDIIMGMAGCLTQMQPCALPVADYAPLLHIQSGIDIMLPSFSILSRLPCAARLALLF